MKKKTKEALINLLESVQIHEAESEYSDVSVDMGDLKHLLLWAQNSSYTWFKGDRVKPTGASTPYYWLDDESVRGTVYDDSGEDGRVYVEWDNAPEEYRRVEMFHNEIKKVL